MFSKQAALAVCFLAVANANPFPTLKVARTVGVNGPTGTGTGVSGPTGTGVPTNGTRAPKMGGPGVVAYWGQSGGNLTMVCSDDSYSAIVLAFVNNYFQAGGYPSLSMSPWAGPSAAQKSAGATDLMDGTSLVPAIQLCQSTGKKVFISIGGEASTSNFTSDAQGSEFANTIWDLFLGGHNATVAPLRPFGNITLDGVDIDAEQHDRTGYMGFVQQMRSNFATDKNNNYYITAAPQCPRNVVPGETGDSSLSDEVLQNVDMAWIQFYNNQAAECNHGQSGFLSAVQAWAQAIAPANLWIGAPGGPTTASASNGYANVTVMQQEVQEIFKLNATNIGGWMLWDAMTALNNSNYQAAVASAIKQDNTTAARRRF